MALAILVDFDNTVTSSDASYAILDHFAEGDWRRIEEEAFRGRYTILEALEIQSSMVRGDPKAIDAHVLSTVSLREGFLEFARWCSDNSVHLEICSDGFGHTIPLILKREGSEHIPYTSNRTWFEGDRMRIAFDHKREGCPVNANCKCSHLERLMSSYEDVIYVGDGATDACVASKASHLLARDWLAEYCKGGGIEYIEWSGWQDVIEYASSLL